MTSNFYPWVEYIPDIVQEPSAPRLRKGRRLIIPDSGDAFFVQGEFDDGNGMWIITGVSCDLSTDLTEGVPRRAIPQTPESHGTETDL